MSHLLRTAASRVRELVSWQCSAVTVSDNPVGSDKGGSRGAMGIGRLVPAMLLALVAWPAIVSAQCRPPSNTNEAKLLAFYSAPIEFSPAGAPEVLAPGSVTIGAEVVPIPRPDAAIEQTSFCYEGKRENTRLAPVFGRPRIAVGLPVGFALEASFVPPVKMWDAEPLLASMAISNARVLPFAPGRSRLTLLLRAQGTVGRVRGPITCPSSGLQTGDPNSPCFGSEPSRDTFHPYMFGSDGALSLATTDGKWSVYAGGGVSWLRPRFQVGFTDGVGTTDSTRISVDLTRGALFGGVSARVWRVMRLSAQVYSVPADATVWRFGFDYVIR
ncbi:MAG TPA: hypothetical protein VIQ60_03610 [Gemmatimonadaceae bacterium]